MRKPITDMMPQPADKSFVDWFNAVLPELVNIAEKNIAKGAMHMAALLVFSTDGQLAIVPVELTTTKTKDAATRLHRFIGGQDIVHAAVLVNESWILALDNDSPPHDRTKSLEFHPDRKEAVTFNAIRRNMQLLATCIIKRPENTLEKPIITDANGSTSGETGRFTLRGFTKDDG